MWGFELMLSSLGGLLFRVGTCGLGGSSWSGFRVRKLGFRV